LRQAEYISRNEWYEKYCTILVGKYARKRTHRRPGRRYGIILKIEMQYKN
jgi:hypothetical protein